MSSKKSDEPTGSASSHLNDDDVGIKRQKLSGHKLAGSIFIARSSARSEASLKEDSLNKESPEQKSLDLDPPPDLNLFLSVSIKDSGGIDSVPQNSVFEKSTSSVAPTSSITSNDALLSTKKIYIALESKHSINPETFIPEPPEKHPFFLWVQKNWDKIKKGVNGEGFDLVPNQKPDGCVALPHITIYLSESRFSRKRNRMTEDRVKMLLELANNVVGDNGVSEHNSENNKASSSQNQPDKYIRFTPKFDFSADPQFLPMTAGALASTAPFVLTYPLTEESREELEKICEEKLGLRIPLYPHVTMGALVVKSVRRRSEKVRSVDRGESVMEKDEDAEDIVDKIRKVVRKQFGTYLVGTIPEEVVSLLG